MKRAVYAIACEWEDVFPRLVYNRNSSHTTMAQYLENLLSNVLCPRWNLVWKIDARGFFEAPYRWQRSMKWWVCVWEFGFIRRPIICRKIFFFLSFLFRFGYVIHSINYDECWPRFYHWINLFDGSGINSNELHLIADTLLGKSNLIEVRNVCFRVLYDEYPSIC